MSKDLETVSLSNLTLRALNERTFELNDFATERANQVVMMFVFELVTRHTIIKVALLG